MATLDQKIFEALSEMQGAARNSEVIKRVLEKHPTTNRSSVASKISALKKSKPEDFGSAGNGWISLAGSEGAAAQPEDTTLDVNDPQESALYEPVRRFLIEDELVTAAEITGSSRMNRKWGNPDLFGIVKPAASDPYKFPLEFIALEVKRDTTNLVTAFGQAASYRLFSHQSYVVVPCDEKSAEYRRIDALCELFGIGLIDFSFSNNEASFRVQVRPVTHAPDHAYVNDFLTKLDRATYNKLLPG